MVFAVALAPMCFGCGCASVSKEKREQVQRAQQTGIYSYQRIQRQKDAQAAARRY